MNIKFCQSIYSYKYDTAQLLKKILSPLCGISQEIGFVNRGTNDQRLMVGSAALYGMHILLNQTNPGKGAYHIGGSGFLPNETMIKILAESLERSAQLISHLTFERKLYFANYSEMQNLGHDILPEKYLKLYHDVQLTRSHFPFDKYDITQPCSWIKMQDFTINKNIYIPAQLILVGYQIKRQHGEPWITSAVTTGTAAHSNYLAALRSSILELIQLDSVMGHWYTNSKAFEIKFDKRLEIFSSLLKRYSCKLSNFRFYFLPNPDLASFTVACLYLQEKGIPKVAIGLGADLSLETAMYKAFLETVATVSLSRMLILKTNFDEVEKQINDKHFYNLDTNVAYYGKGYFFNRIEERFLNMDSVEANDLPPDNVDGCKHQIQLLINSFKNSQKNLFFLDLTTEQEEQLGFKILRVWSPQTLSLCLPSAVPMEHPRFKQYGGIQHDDPHPYP